MTQITDMLTAVVDILKADAGVIAQVSGRVFGDELPQSETASMPRKCIVIKPSGGVVPPFAAATVPLEVQRLDIWCYGETMIKADQVRRAVFGAMRAISRTIQGGVLVHWARPAGGSAAGRDDAGEWPYRWNSWQVMSDERAVS